ncbi:MAG TPA: STY0301 family protein [Rhodocyclaceae bacterium]|nr:STY0301 family protein [Rhodocyclaceae bacterium]
MNRQPLLCALLLMSLPAVASDEIEFRCPPRISAIQKLAQPVPGWRESLPADDGHFLALAMFSDGAPEKQAWLVPDSEDQPKNKVSTAKWKFAASENIWLSCQYRQTTVMVSRQLPAGLKRCSIRMDPSKAIEVQRVWCEK